MLGLKNTESVKNFFKDLKILTVYSHYVLETKYVKEHNSDIFYESNHPYNTCSKIIFYKYNLEFKKKKNKI
jgi:hypothetical protein